jgi:hypothetical protein
MIPKYIVETAMWYSLGLAEEVQSNGDDRSASSMFFGQLGRAAGSESESIVP